MKRAAWTGPALALAGAAAFALLAHFAAVEAERIRIAGITLPDICPARNWGWDCPGCGITRASLLLARGDWRAAWTAHPGAYVLLGVVLQELSAMLWAPRARSASRWALAAVLLIVSLSRWLW